MPVGEDAREGARGTALGATWKGSEQIQVKAVACRRDTVPTVTLARSSPQNTEGTHCGFPHALQSQRLLSSPAACCVDDRRTPGGHDTFVIESHRGTSLSSGHVTENHKIFSQPAPPPSCLLGNNVHSSCRCPPMW